MQVYTCLHEIEKKIITKCLEKKIMHLQISQTEKLMKSIMNEYWFVYPKSNKLEVKPTVYVNIKKCSRKISLTLPRFI